MKNLKKTVFLVVLLVAIFSCSTRKDTIVSRNFHALTTKYNVAVSQISAHGVGQLSPLAINNTEEGRALNRRVEVVLK